MIAADSGSVAARINDPTIARTSEGDRPPAPTPKPLPGPRMSVANSRPSAETHDSRRAPETTTQHLSIGSSWRTTVLPAGTATVRGSGSIAVWDIATPLVPNIDPATDTGCTFASAPSRAREALERRPGRPDRLLRLGSGPSRPAPAPNEAQGGVQMPKRGLEALTTVPLFQGLSRRDLRRIGDIGIETEYMSGELVVKQGEEADSFFVMVAGEAKVSIGDR